MDDNDSSKENSKHSRVHNIPVSPDSTERVATILKTEKTFPPHQRSQNDVIISHLQNGCEWMCNKNRCVSNPGLYSLMYSPNEIQFHRPFRFDDDDEREVVNLLNTIPRELPYARDQVL